ncbi:helix-turn-helix domain-containing protein [Devosia sp. Leaf64]|uniref:winged helix-turn-helix transcriptional regulator n=1 Tax=Devosia sp. Leaf64 TaxID=1736229 RepID=UPI0012E0D293|nr:helix-turn-helix domain-containing protein [Devosia sp. Leaf64]
MMTPSKPVTPGIDPNRADHCRVVAAVLDRIGDKWTIMVVSELTDGPARFTEIMREIGGITHRMLTLTLRGLERDGLVTRTAYATVPPRVEYELTELGHTLTTTLIPLAHWSEANWQTIRASQQRHDARSDSVRADQATVPE